MVTESETDNLIGDRYTFLTHYGKALTMKYCQTLQRQNDSPLTGSIKNTLEAAVSVIPWPPAFNDMRITVGLFGSTFMKDDTACCLFVNDILPSMRTNLNPLSLQAKTFTMDI